jgi:uncharacterized damage-inducible protein DinB
MNTSLADNMIETWYIHNRVNLYLLNALEDQHLSAVSASKGRTVAEQFAHIHNVRLMWLKEATPMLFAQCTKLEKGSDLSKDTLTQHLHESAEAIAKLLRTALETGKVKGFKPHATAFLGYLISHESHHRGQIALALKQSGTPLDKKVAFGLWEWGVR